MVARYAAALSLGGVLAAELVALVCALSAEAVAESRWEGFACARRVAEVVVLIRHAMEAAEEFRKLARPRNVPFERPIIMVVDFADRCKPKDVRSVAIVPCKLTCHVCLQTAVRPAAAHAEGLGRCVEGAEIIREVGGRCAGEVLVAER